MIAEIKQIMQDIGEGRLSRASNSLRAGMYQRAWKYFGFLPSSVPYQPTSIAIGITTRCNLKCEMCWRQFTPVSAPRDIELGTFARILNSFPHVRSVALLGFGEPLLHPNFFEMMKILKSRKIAIEFATNGTLLNEKMAKEFVALEVDRIHISVDGAISHTFETIRRGAKFDQVVGNATMLASKRKQANKSTPHIIFEFVGMRQNIAELPELVELAHRVGVDGIHFLHPSSYSREIDKQHLDQSEETAAILRKAIKISSKNGINLVLRPLKPMPQPCLMPWFGSYITQDGDVRACPYIGCLTCPMEEWYEGIPIPINPEDVTFGNVLKEDFANIWNCQRYRRFRTELKRFMKEDKEQEWGVENYGELRSKTPGNYCRICQWRFMTGC